MNVNEYERRTRQTAIYPGAGDDGDKVFEIEGGTLALMYTALGLAGEAGEITNKIKKVLRDDGMVLTEEKKMQLSGELGDLAWYFVRLCDELGLAPSTVLQENLEKLFDRKDRGVLGGEGDNR